MSRSSYSANRQPFIHLTTALVAGILLDRLFEPAVWMLACSAVAASAVAAAAFLLKTDAAASLALLFAIASAGSLLAYAERSAVDETRLKRLFAEQRFTADDPLHLTGSLAVPPEPAPGAFYLDVNAESILLRGQEILATGGVRLIVAVEDPLSREEFDRLGLDYSSRVRILARLERARSYRNPGSPDFNEFLERAGFDLTGVVKSPLLIERLDDGPAPSMLGWLYRARLRWMDTIDARFRPDVAGTLKAMLLGNRYFLDPESADRLRESSTFHIISISGMHVGLIAWAMLGGWSPSRRRRTFHVVLALSGLWLYALMAGLQPPVTRATLMITVGLFAPIIFRRAASVNTVALAAFLMLALKPSLVADPGFQLSFIAVTAIVAVAVPLSNRLRQTGEWIPTAKTPHPPFCSEALKTISECLFWNERRFRAEMRHGTTRYNLDKALAARSIPIRLLQPVLRWTVILAITSTAIQIATLPLSVLYFNRIAPVGVLINLISGMMAAALMLGGVAASLLDPVIPWLASQAESVVAFAHHLLIHAAGPFTPIPGASFRVPHFDDWRAGIYVVYLALVVMMAVLIDRWRPVYQVEPGDKPASFNPARSLILLFRLAIRPGQAVAVCVIGLVVCSIAIARPASPAATGKLTVHEKSLWVPRRLRRGGKSVLAAGSIPAARSASVG